MKRWDEERTVEDAPTKAPDEYTYEEGVGWGFGWADGWNAAVANYRAQLQDLEAPE